MNQPSGSGKGSLIRLVILLVLLGLVGYAFYNDMSVKAPQSDQVATRISDLQDLFQQTSADVQKVAGMKPQATFDIEKKYTVEEYRFMRTIPFFKLRSVYAVYKDEYLYRVFDEVKPTLAQIEGKNSELTVDFKKPEGPLPVPSMSGGGPPASSDKQAPKKDDAAEAPKSEGDQGDNSKANEPPAAEKTDANPPAEEKKDEEKKDGESSDKPAEEPKSGDAEKPAEDGGKGG